ncbi:NACHT domain-containing NTPase [Paenarthrobacter sp. YAF11_1]|uniref:NACHT domain-containing protein n=1 Tax=Paenarthrobacter sp. YAF11_1 TaxID=3233074 RepID=UPI003F9E87C5
MDPFSISAAAGTAAKTGGALIAGAKSVLEGGRFAARKLRQYGRYDPKWLNLGLENEALTASQVADVHAFLTSPRLQPVLRFMALSILTPTSEGHNDIKETMKVSFRTEADRWLETSSEKWKDSVDAIWLRLIDIYETFVRPIDPKSELFAEAENYTRFLSSPLGNPVNDTGLATTYLNRMTELAGDLDLLASAGTSSMQLAQLIKASGYGPIINHIDVANTQFQDLYVNRSFIQSNAEQRVNSDSLVTSENPFRVVLKGAPGAGKSTFVSHFVQTLAASTPERPGVPTIVIRCREYAGASWTLTLTEYGTQKLKAQLGADFLTASLTEAMLLTGQLAVVFDGLDEVMDRSQRVEMVQRIQAFSAQYPPTSILITTRAVGYERAPVDPRLFVHLELQEFSPAQVAEYANRWFATAGRPELSQSFLFESETVSDLRINPLLLSLLCTLYRSSGEIPTNRREIYEECAQLLFKRWDAHRQVHVPHSMPSFANELMREIARWFYTNTSAQAGVEERQIAKAISVYMVDEIGMSLDESREQSKQFLNFCATRAWLLGSPGTNTTGQRIYSFVHRTFFEFFASEAFARSDDASPSNIADRIREAFERDATSVLPELLIQSYHSVRKRGATHVFEELCKPRPSPAPSLLLLRLLDGAVLARYALTSGFALLQTRWEASGEIPRDEFLALLSVNTVARNLFVNEFLLTAPGGAARGLFIGSWASYRLSGGRRFENTWASAVQQALDTHGAELEMSDDECVINWRLTTDLPAQKLEDPWSYIRTVGAFGPADGFVWWAIKTMNSTNLTEAQLSAVNAVHELIAQGRQIPNHLIELWDRNEHFTLSPLLRWSEGSEEAIVKLREILVVILFALHEEHVEKGQLEAAADSWPGRISQVAAYRDWRIGVGKELSPARQAQARATLRVLPTRLLAWVKGEGYLLEDSSYE